MVYPIINASLLSVKLGHFMGVLDMSGMGRVRDTLTLEREVS